MKKILIQDYQDLNLLLKNGDIGSYPSNSNEVLSGTPPTTTGPTTTTTTTTTSEPTTTTGGPTTSTTLPPDPFDPLAFATRKSHGLVITDGGPGGRSTSGNGKEMADYHAPWWLQ